MAKVIIDENILNDIAIKLQNRLGTDDKFTPRNFGGGIDSIISLLVMRRFPAGVIKLELSTEWGIS